MSADEVILSLKTQRDGILNALASDAVNPQPNYSVDGQSVDRVGWRNSMMNQLKELNIMLSQYELTEFTMIGF